MKKDLSFNFFVSLREADGNQQPTGYGSQIPFIAPENESPLNGSAGQSPPTELDKEGVGEKQHDRYVEKRTEAVSEKIDELFDDLEGHNRQHAMDILTSKLSALANQHGLDTEVIKNNLNFQNEPKSRPLQPMADG